MLTKAGCYIVRHGSRHDIWYSPITGLQSAVPRHGAQELGYALFLKLKKDLLGN